jgi:hypothetical protein
MTDRSRVFAVGKVAAFTAAAFPSPNKVLLTEE